MTELNGTDLLSLVDNYIDALDCVAEPADVLGQLVWQQEAGL